MRLDTHVHTSPGSRCSQMTIESYLEAASELGLGTICVTNHGELGDYETMLALATAELRIIPGVEISSPEGDFLVYSTDLSFLDSLEAVQSLPEKRSRPAETAVIWAHPFAGNPGGSNAASDYIREIANMIDGIEIYNGNWPDEEASELARRIALEFDLAELGGSDTHRRESLMRCHTVFTGEITNSAELVAAILDMQTVAEKV